MSEIRVWGTGERLDKLLSSDGLSRSRAAALIKQGQASVNGKVVMLSSFCPKETDEVVLYAVEPEDTSIKGEDIHITILYEDDSLAVVVKPYGMVVHPAAGNESGTLVNALVYQLSSLSGIGGERRPGIVHRLDKDTSGLLIVAKDDQAHAELSRQLAQREIEKHYLALVAGQMKGMEGSIDVPLGRSLKDRKKIAVRPDGRNALTKWKLLAQHSDRALLQIELITGRTHQIRVHMTSIGHPVLGDPLYSLRGTPKAARMMLHAWKLAFRHPKTGKQLYFTAEPDESFGLDKIKTLPDDL